jgi:hypothetical protein
MGAARAWSHPNMREVAEALRADPDFERFAEGGAYIQTNQGLGWGADTMALAAAIVDSAARAVVAKGLDTDDSGVLEDEVAATYDAVRRLVRGETVTTFYLVGYDGLTLEEGGRVELPWGTLRPAGPLDVGFGDPVRASCVLLIPAELRFRISHPQKGARPEMENVEMPDAVPRAARLFGLATLLGVRRPKPLSPAPVWGTSLTPGATGRGGWASGRRICSVHVLGFPRSGGEPLTAAEQEDLSRWAYCAEERYHESIEVAAERIILALLERENAADALIDAVIALENLFGHGGKTEVFFRVSAATAHLLARDAAKRPALRSEISDIYDMRSTVIHGGRIWSQDALKECSERAIDLTVEALRALFSERPHLLSDRERGMRLILGTADSPGPPDDPA